jgi:O-antigen/teichoic acid export membrane protein
MRINALTNHARVFGSAVISQAALSATNFAVSFMLIRRTTDNDYGSFVLVQSAIAMLVAAQSAWTIGPLSVIVFRQPPEMRKTMVGAVRASLFRIVRRVAAVALLIPLIAYFLAPQNALPSAVMAIGVLAAWAALQRDFLRGTLFMYRRPEANLRADLVYCALLLTGATLAAFLFSPPAIWAVGGLAIAALAGARMAYRSFAADPGWESGDAAPVWREMRPIAIWSAIGAIVYVLFTQGYNFVLAARLSLSAVAAINAARLLLMPPVVLSIGVSSILMPSAAMWLNEGGFPLLLRRLLGFMVGLSILDFFYFAFVWFCRDWLTDSLLHKTIPDRERLLMLWAGIAYVGLLRDMLQSTLFALGNQKWMAGLSAMGAVVALTIMWFGIPVWGSAAALTGQIAGEALNMLGLVALMRISARAYARR